MTKYGIFDNKLLGTKSDMLTLPVDIGSHLEGWARSEGILELHSDSLVLNLQSKDTVLGVLKSGVRKVTIPFNIVEEITFKSGLFRCRLEIRLTDLKALSQIPNSKDGRIRLKTSKRDKSNAMEIQSICNLAIADSRLKKMGEIFQDDKP